MGAVTEMLAKRDRRDARHRISLWGLLWGIPVGGVFFAGYYLVPEAGSRSRDTLVWIVYGLLWIAVAFVGEAAVRRSRPSDAKRRCWGLTGPLGWAVFCTIVSAGVHVVPKDSALWTGVPGATGFLVVSVADFIQRRREATAPRG